MIDLLLRLADPSREAEVMHALDEHAAAVKHSAGKSDAGMVSAVEALVRQQPSDAFSLDISGEASMNVGGLTWHAGSFMPRSLAELGRAVASPEETATPARLQLFVIDGGAAPTDIGSLQASAGEGCLFQVASQFNCLESPGSFITPVSRYLNDPTQGPRASISALPGTLLRHYHAPGADGVPFVQVNDGRQINLLEDVCKEGIARVNNGYLVADQIKDPRALLQTLEARFEAIQVGVHENIEVVLGYEWLGSVLRKPNPRIAQVFTSTLAGGAYGQVSGIFEDICRQLLRGAYLGTLLAAITLERPRVVLTLIGGGVFGNPVNLIWEAIGWALDQVAPRLKQELTVVVNGRDLARQLGSAKLLAAVRARGGVLLSWPRGQVPHAQR